MEAVRVRPGVVDHPRSRGVYADVLVGAGRHEGSSPLARGLPTRRRAPRRRRWDHPRSRGVYLNSVVQIDEVMGSSPLARGLPCLDSFRGGWERIIPARAGFTPMGRRLYASLVDHPRSRGVYWGRSGTAAPHQGSSPLARGLHVRSGRENAVAGIIPARAGFTRRSRVRRSWSADHPRSRGVYGGLVSRL